ncbi:glycosyltransferase family 39 protein [Clostridium kluyveri]|uniref:Uncharacterized protein n=2 Tax=Clostridium kluyveri TaxID=1534 RepID=A5N5Y6_CLOK5|nr:glycosyltransferase family 39 protein [Clostridium kluyveri]EDK32717.1 Conserved hypothetical protein [Clostridium kluyveri DSM 555]BAH05639.1 hypothetical protein CKR_0588 [Clostridium kluyveri NBRC 12016]
MIKIFFKKNLLKIGLILLILLSAFLCIYNIKNYTANTNTSRSRVEQFNSENRQRAQINDKQKTQGGVNSNTPNKNFSSNNNKTPGSNAQIPGGRNQRGESMFSNNKYAPLLTLYLIIFFALCITAFYFFGYRNFKINNSNTKILIFSLLCVGLFLRISLSTVMEGYGGDINLFKSWASSAANSLSQFYVNSKSADYPPLYIYILFLIGKLAKISSITPYYTLLLKLPSMIADIVTAYMIYKLAKKYFSLEMGILLSAFYIFSPAIFINSSLWGQVDSFFTLFLVLSLFFLSEGKFVFSSILFTSLVLMKPQGIIFFPVLLFELIARKNLKTLIKCAASCIVTSLVIILPFSFNQNALWIFKLYKNTISEYPYASVNAFNFFNLLGGNYKESSSTFFIFSYKIWGIIAIIAITAFSWYIYIKSKNKIFAFSCALVQISGVFTFSTGMHERYLFPAAALSMLSFIYLKDNRLLILLAGYTLTIYSNIYSILFGGFGNTTSHTLISDGTCILNIILSAYLVKILLDIVLKKKGFNPESFDIKFY